MKKIACWFQNHAAGLKKKSHIKTHHDSGRYFCCLVLTIFLLAIFYPHISVAVSIDGARMPADRQKHTKESVSLKRNYRNYPINLKISLPPAGAGESLLKNTTGKPLQVGFGRDLPSPYTDKIQRYLVWDALKSSGQTTAFTITSPDAASIRLAMQANNIPQGTEIRFFSLSYPEQVFGPFTRQDFFRQTKSGSQDSILFWSPVIEGDTIGVEIYVVSEDAAKKLAFTMPKISHLVYSPLQRDGKNLSDIGDSGSCNIDVVCRTTNIAKDAVAKIIFTQGASSYLCTGTLLNDTNADSWIPYFMTANHCLNSQAVADTINSYWFFERQTCGGPDPTTVTQRTGGGELLSTGSTTDFTLLQLDAAMPANVSYAGWDSAPLPQDATVIGIHHPSGDLKKWSQGSHTGFADYLAGVDGSGSHSRIIWSQGTTEGGSSGSALFDSTYHFRGNLHGGFASCTYPDDPDWYGRFDLTFPSVRSWIWDGPLVIQRNNTYQGSVDQYKSKEYKITTTSQVELKLFNLSQDADLYVRSGNRPTLDQYDCRPYSAGTTEETCTLAGGLTYYVRVRGFSAGTTTFSLKTTSTEGGTGLLPIYLPSLLTNFLNGLGTGDLQVTLTWDTDNTDVDIHVIEPDGSHVYYNHKTGTTATLDVDNTQGYGPENIFVAPGTAASGTYQVYTVFYRGSVPTTATIRITTFANTARRVVKTFTRQLSTADRYTGINVATVDFPAGTITETTGTRSAKDPEATVLKK